MVIRWCSCKRKESRERRKESVGKRKGSFARAEKERELHSNLAPQHGGDVGTRKESRKKNKERGRRD
jgi:hypothetical protein